MSYNPNQPSGSGPAFRRTSYASVAAGTAGSNPSSAFHQPGRPVSRTMSSTAAGSSYPPPSHHSRHRSGGLGMDMDRNAASTSYGAWNNIPGYSSSYSYGTSMSGAPFGPLGSPEAQIPHFFIPSYLRGSRYAEKLEDAHKAKVAAIRDSHHNRSPHSSNPGSLSTSASSANLHKMVPSHRGMTHDIIERAPPMLVEEPPPPLPSRWSDVDRHKGAEVRGSEGLEVAYAGAGVKTSHNGNSEEASAVRADAPMPKQAGIYYFECHVTAKQKDVWIGIGFCGPKTPLERLPGWEQESWAFHGDDGHIFNSHSTGKLYGNHTNLKYGHMDVIGCGVNFRTCQAFFTKNGIHLGTAFTNVKGERLFPCVGMKKPGEMIKVNFGQTPFVYDIDNLMAREKMTLQDTVTRTTVVDGTGLIHALAAQYLAMDGYVETARAFAAEVGAESEALSSGGTDALFPNLEPEEDLHAVNRQRIRAAILQGNIDHALKLTEHKYPSVLRDNENIYFKLKCRKYVEMIRQLDESRQRQFDPPSPSTSIKKSVGSMGTQDSNGLSVADEFSDVFGVGHQMELDDQLQLSVEQGISNGFGTSSATATNGAERMETDSRPMTSNGNLDDSSEQKGSAELLPEILKYGQELSQEFKDDPRREVKRALEETFALIAYAEPHAGPLAGLLDESGRVPVAEELNAAILISLGKASSSALERMVQTTHVLVEELGEDGGFGAFINVTGDYMR